MPPEDDDSSRADLRVDFYLLAHTQAECKHTYACRIADKAHGRGMTVFIRAEDAAQGELLDRLLWTFAQGSFVPHSFCDDAAADGDAHDPVRIGCHDAAPADAADLLITLTRDAPQDYARFGRIAELILDDADDKAAGRARFQFYREHGIEPQTHKIPASALR